MLCKKATLRVSASFKLFSQPPFSVRTKPRHQFLQGTSPLIPGASTEQERGAACRASAVPAEHGKRLPPWEAASDSRGPTESPLCPTELQLTCQVSTTLGFSLWKKYSREIRHINHVLNKSCFEDRLGKNNPLRPPAIFYFYCVTKTHIFLSWIT